MVGGYPKGAGRKARAFASLGIELLKPVSYLSDQSVEVWDEVRLAFVNHFHRFAWAFGLGKTRQSSLSRTARLHGPGGRRPHAVRRLIDACRAACLPGGTRR
jgi:hypothetical protein